MTFHEQLEHACFEAMHDTQPFEVAGSLIMVLASISAFEAGCYNVDFNEQVEVIHHLLDKAFVAVRAPA